MSEYGLKIYRDDGSLLMSPDVTPMSYVGKYRYTDSCIIQLSVPDTADIILFIRNDDVNGATHLAWAISDGKWYMNVNTSGVGWVYVFANIVTVEHDIELVVYDVNGRMTWNTDCLPLAIMTVPNPWDGSPTSSSSMVYGVDVGFPAAVMPGICPDYLIVLNSQMPLYLCGSMVVRAHGNTVGTRVRDGQQTNRRPPLSKLRVNYIYIDT